jgi:hypothetical protein
MCGVDSRRAKEFSLCQQVQSRGGSPVQWEERPISMDTATRADPVNRHHPVERLRKCSFSLNSMTRCLITAQEQLSSLHERQNNNTYNPSHSKFSGTHCTNCDVVWGVSWGCLDCLELLGGLWWGRGPRNIVRDYPQLVEHKWDQPGDRQCRSIRIWHPIHCNPSCVSCCLSLRNRFTVQVNL